MLSDYSAEELAKRNELIDGIRQGRPIVDDRPRLLPLRRPHRNIDEESFRRALAMKRAMTVWLEVKRPLHERLWRKFSFTVYAQWLRFKWSAEGRAILKRIKRNEQFHTQN